MPAIRAKVVLQNSARESSLSLLVFLDFARNAHNSIPLEDSAVSTHFFHRSSYFHCHTYMNLVNPLSFTGLLLGPENNPPPTQIVG